MRLLCSLKMFEVNLSRQIFITSLAVFMLTDFASSHQVGVTFERLVKFFGIALKRLHCDWKFYIQQSV